MAAYHPNLIPFTGGHEGKVLKWYRDPTGTPTIGYGFTWASRIFREWWLAEHGRKMKAGDTISEADALFLLRMIIEAEYLPPVTDAIRAAKASVSPHAVAASTDMTYNCGPKALTWSWFKMLLAGRVREAAGRYRVTAQTSKGRKLPGLVRRRAEGANILAHNVWPSWLKATKSASDDDVEKAMPRWRLLREDFIQGQRWLKQLGYYSGPEGGENTEAMRAAVLAFQRAHPQLTNDGILGRATLDQLQRVTDLKRKAAATAAAGGAPAGAGRAEAASGADITGLDVWLIGGGVAILVIGGCWLAWRYRDEVSIAARSLLKAKGRPA